VPLGSRLEGRSREESDVEDDVGQNDMAFLSLSNWTH
jgi:hypothetical protein